MKTSPTSGAAAAGRFALLIAMAAGSAVFSAAQTSPADGPWVGMVQSTLDVQTPTYRRQETHTWTLTGEAPTTEGEFRIYTAMWSVTGEGSFKKSQGAQLISTTWTVNVPPRPTKVAMLIRASDQKLILRHWKSATNIAGAIRGSRQITTNGLPGPAAQITGAMNEWSFMWIEGEKQLTTLAGTKNTNAEYLPTDFHFSGQPTNATCTWQLTKGTGAARPTIARGPLPTRPISSAPVTPPAETPTKVPEKIVVDPPAVVPARRLRTISVTPAAVVRGAKTFYVTINGNLTNFAQGRTKADFGPGVTVQFVDAHTPERATAVIDVAATALPGKRTVKLTTGDEVVTLEDGFLVKASTTPPVATSDHFSVGRDRTLVAGVVRLGTFNSVLAARDYPSGAFARIGNKVFFHALKGMTQSGLWVSDGTPAGTVFLKGCMPQNLTAVGSRVFFSATSPGLGDELWVSDGTPNGTTLVKDTVPGSGSFPKYSFTDVNGTLFFLMEVNPTPAIVPLDLWKSDGTSSGTVLLKSGLVINPQYLLNVGGALFFIGWEIANPQGPWLWKSDGTAAGTSKVFKVRIVPSGNGEANRLFAEVNGTAFMASYDPGSANSDRPGLWRSDGTPQGSLEILNLNAKGPSAIRTPVDFKVVNGMLYFSILECFPGVVRELWRSDGTTAGTIALKTGLNSGVPTATDIFPTALGGRLYFCAKEGNGGYGLWKTDGTIAGTSLVKDLSILGSGEPFERNAHVYAMVAAADRLFFTTDGGLWRSDGTEGGTIRVSTLKSVHHTPVDGGVLFTAQRSDGENGRDLWRSGIVAAVTANDALPAGVSPSVTLVSGPAHGTLTLGADGSFIYQPAAGFTGTDQFAYMVGDGAETSQPASVSITVTPM